MTRIVYRRCLHCKDRYEYQQSGHGCLGDLNDGDYCPGCKKVILEALSAVPPVAEKTWLATTEVTLKELLDAEEKERSRQIEAGGLMVRRVAFPLFEISTGRSNANGIVRTNGKTYKYSFWPGKESEVEISIEGYKDLRSGSFEPI